MEVDRERLQLREDRAFISPPYLDPVWQCGTAVVVRGFVAGAMLDVEVAGAIVVSGFAAGFPLPDGALVPLPSPLSAGQAVRARQAFGGAVSGWSAPVTAADHHVDFPAGPPRPQINPAPVYRCGTRTGVANLLAGCKVWITADGVEVGRVDGAATHQGVNVAPSYGLGQAVVAWASLCDDPSPPSEVQTSQPPPAPLPAPGFLPVIEGGSQLTVTNVVNGAQLTLSRNGILQFSFSSWGYQHLVGLDPPFHEGETFSITQQLCPGDPPSGGGSTTVLPCSALRAPGVEPVQAGDTQVRVYDFVPDARIKVFVNGMEVGDGSGPVVQLGGPVPRGATVHVLQVLGNCVGRTVQELTAQCVAPPIGGDPSALDLFPVGSLSYDAGPTTVTTGFSQNVVGTIYYPADADGDRTPFNRRRAGLGRVPVAVLVHGRHGGDPTSYLGYAYLQRQLARMGIIAMSVDCHESDGWSNNANNILERADLIIASIRHLQSLDAGGDPIFGGRVDFSRLGLMGHSRGGEAVILVPEIISLAGVRVAGVISLAPVNFGATRGRPSYPFMTIVPACDGDVVGNEGCTFYDAAEPGGFESQLYVHFANHNYFNRNWLNDDADGGLPLMSRPDHERILSVYGCAFFRTVLLDHPLLGYLEGTVRPSGVPTANIHLSFKKERQITVDDHQDGNGIGVNSMNAPTAQSGLVAGEHPFEQDTPGRFNDSFFGNTIGMVAQGGDSNGVFRTQLDGMLDLRRREIWIRAAEVYNGRTVADGATGFMLGLEDVNGAIGWVDSDGVGGLPRPLHRRDYDLNQWYHADKTKTVPKTLRFPVSCFAARGGEFDSGRVVAIRLHLNRPDQRALAFDDLQIVMR